MNKQDWTKAPEDAQFYAAGYFRKHEGDEEYAFNDLSMGWFKADYLSIEEVENFPDFEWNPKKPQHSKYHREIKPSVYVDVYDVLAAWGVSNPALQHLIKKALQPGERGHKTLEQDMDDIIASAARAKELEL